MEYCDSSNMDFLSLAIQAPVCSPATRGHDHFSIICAMTESTKWKTLKCFLVLNKTAEYWSEWLQPFRIKPQTWSFNYNNHSQNCQMYDSLVRVRYWYSGYAFVYYGRAFKLDWIIVHLFMKSQGNWNRFSWIRNIKKVNVKASVLIYQSGFDCSATIKCNV